MLRKYVAWVMLLTVAAAAAWAQGLNVPAGVTKDDWEEINFEFNSSVLVDGFPSLLRLAELLQQNPGYRVRVEGHTDIIGGNQYNERLGLARANAVKDFLVKYGAQAGQIDAVTIGKANPRYPGQKQTYSRTDDARWMNRRVALTVMDAQGRTVGAGGANEAIRAIAPQPAQGLTDCCNEVLKRLDKLDDIAKMLKDLADQNADLRKQVNDLKNAQDALRQGQQTLESKVNEQPKPPTTAEVASEVAKAVEGKKLPHFQLLGMNVGADDTGNTTFTGKGRYFAPLNQHFGFQADAEYMYFKAQREGQFDVGMVDRFTNRLQTGLFASFKHVTLEGYQSGGTLGQGAFTLDYLFSRGKVGVFGTKSFLDNALINSVNATDPRSGALLDHIFLNSYLKVVDQAGASGSIGLWGNNYAEGNAAYLHSVANGNRFGGTLRFVMPINSKVAFTVEGGMNETLLASGNSGRAVVGLQFSNMLRPKEFLGADHPVPADVPRVRYEILTKRVRLGNDPPVADAGPNQVNVLPGTIQLDGSNSYDPDGDPITYQWIQEVGPPVTLSAPTSAKTTFTSVAGQLYGFRLTVKDNFGAQSSARVTVSTRTAEPVQILFFIADPNTIVTGQSSTLSWKVINATTVSISGIGNVQAEGSTPVAPGQTTTYTITASGANGASTDSCSITVTVTPGQLPRIIRFSAVPPTINSGQTSTLLWVVENADTVTIDKGLGNVSLGGTQDVSPAATTVYTLTATNKTGSVTAQATVNVNVIPPPKVVSFTATPNPSPAPGTKVTLACNTTGATSITLAGVLFLPPNPTFVVFPTVDTTYTCIATNQQGQTDTASVTVKVTQPVVTPPVPGPTVVVAGGLSQTTIYRTITLDASSTTSPNPPLTFQWSLANGVPAAISSPNSPITNIQLGNETGEYDFNLTVTDSKGNSTTVTVKVYLLATHVQ